MLDFVVCEEVVVSKEGVKALLPLMMTQVVPHVVVGSEYHTFSFQFIERPSNGSHTYSFYHKAAASGLYLFGQRSNASVTYEYRPNMTFTADNWI